MVHGFSTIPVSEPINIPTADHGEKVFDLILSGSLADEIQTAMKYVKDNVPESPRGIACPIRTPDVVRHLMDTQPEGSIMASGSLRVLIIEETAVNTLDGARVKYMLSEFDSLAAFKKAIGPINTNVDMYDQSNLKQSRRLNKDAEVQSL